MALSEREISLIETIGKSVRKMLSEQEAKYIEMMEEQSLKIKTLQDDVSSLLDLLAEK